MILEKYLVSVGKLTKTHGIKGEISIQLTNEFIYISDFSYIVCKIDGIFVPFFIEEVRPKTNTTYLLKLENINSETEAGELTGSLVFLPKEMLGDDFPEELTWKSFIGFLLTDKNSGFSGEITDVDDSTDNILFSVKNETGEEILLPANEDFIVDFNEKEKVMTVMLPEGLIDLN
jgi:16S rRNA processing protein RimM